MGKKYARRFKSIIVLAIALIVVFSFGGVNIAEARHFHTPAELARLHDLMQSAPYDTNTYFATGGRCGGCHGHDPNGISLITPSGEDVNIMDDWAGTMMANSAKDPLWRAKVSHEILINPGHQTEIEDKCTACHAPTGHFEAHFLGQPYYTIASLPADSFGMDGVNCSACHAQKDSLMGHNYSGDLQYAQKHEWGPIQNPVSAVMEFFVGFQIDYSPHVSSSEFCAGCHTLITQTNDLAGNPTGGSYIEQATYLEWKNSQYRVDSNNCQSCHIPRILDSIRLATDYPWIEARSPFGKHHLVGGNEFMLKLMRNNMSAIGATCQPYNFDTTIARTNRFLRDSTLDMQVVQTARTVDTAFYDVQLTNKAGHKFPSGYPSRIAWVQFVVRDNIGDTIFQSGMLDANGNIIGRDPGFEPHHDVCYTNNDVQIYEMVMGDVANNPTTVLERADTCLKDNRIVPKGFSTSHPSYDSTMIIGVNNDADFNYSGPTEGTGSDVVHYHVFINGYGGPLNITSTVYYESVPRAWLQDMFSLSSMEIDTFKYMYNTADQTPQQVAQVIMNNTITSSEQNTLHPELSVYPVPSADGHLKITGWQKANVMEIHVYDLAGKEVMNPIEGKEFNGEINLPGRGVFLVVFTTKEGKIVKRVVW